DLGEHLEPAADLGEYQGLVLHAEMRSAPVCFARVPCGEQQLEGVGYLLRVLRALQKVAVDTVADLLAQSTGWAGQHGTPLPHGLGRGEAESLAQRILHHQRRAALERVDDQCVFLE